MGRPSPTALAAALLGLAVGLAPFALDPAETTDLPGFTAAGARAEREAEARLVSLLQATSLDAFHAELTARPHVAGTEESRALAEAIRRRLEGFGLETEIRRYDAYLSYPKRIAVRRTAPSVLELRVDEPADLGDPASGRPADPDTTQPGVLPGYVAYSPSGRVEGEIVYANHGLPVDYDALESRGVTARGRIALVRYGKVHRAVKVATAQARGAKGILIYSDPADDGHGKGDVLPKGPWRALDLLQRGNGKMSWFFHGDPLTPGRPALPGAERLRPEESPVLPRIPAAVLSARAGRSLLEGLSGRAPEGFAGGLDLAYGTGPGPVRAELDLEMEAGLRPIVNVIARIRGRDEPDRVVLLGTHHDAWTFGGVDPGSAGASILELARALSVLRGEGWQPRRTLAFAFWDAEEPGLVGSTEYAEEMASVLRAQAVAYVNSDLYLAGRVRAGGPPALQEFVRSVLGDARDPATGRPGWPGASTAELQALGSGADFVAFQDYLGLPTLSLELGEFTSYGAYHSSHDTRHYMRTHGDPGWRYGLGLAELLGRAVMRLASAESVPVRPSQEAEAILRWLDRLAAASPGLDPEALASLRRDLQSLREAAAALEAVREGALLEGGAAVARAAGSGDRLVASLKAFVDDEDPQFYRHPIYGWDIHALYGGSTLPGLGQVLREGRAGAARMELARLAAAVARARAALADR